MVLVWHYVVRYYAYVRESTIVNSAVLFYLYLSLQSWSRHGKSGLEARHATRCLIGRVAPGRPMATTSFPNSQKKIKIIIITKSTTNFWSRGKLAKFIAPLLPFIATRRVLCSHQFVSLAYPYYLFYMWLSTRYCNFISQRYWNYSPDVFFFYNKI